MPGLPAPKFCCGQWLLRSKTEDHLRRKLSLENLIFLSEKFTKTCTTKWIGLDKNDDFPTACEALKFSLGQKSNHVTLLYFSYQI